MKTVWVKHKGALYPAEERAADVNGTIADGDEVMIEIRRPRNLKHHKKFFKLLSIVLENQDLFKTNEQLLTFIKRGIGHVDEYGEVKSIAFEKMDQTEFNEFYKKSVDFICMEVIPGMDHEALMAEVEHFL